MPVTLPVILELLLAHGEPLNANVPLTELPFCISFPVPITFANVGEVGALNFTIIQVPLKLGSNGFAPPQPVTKKSAIIPVRLTKVALTIEFLAIDLMTMAATAWSCMPFPRRSSVCSRYPSTLIAGATLPSLASAFTIGSSKCVPFVNVRKNMSLCRAKSRRRASLSRDINERPADEQAAFHSAYADGTYPYKDFKTHVEQALRAKFENSVKPGTKAIRIESNGNRRNADVIVAFEYRLYYKFKSRYDESHDTGICFSTSDGTQIANYPNQHCENLTAKHQATGSKFKPLVRIFKNMRSKLIEDSLIEEGSAPSYYIEGLLYNVPNDRFVGDCQDICLNILNWLYETADRTELVCANEQYYLLRDNSPTCWACADGEKFVDAAIKLWNDW